MRLFNTNLADLLTPLPVANSILGSAAIACGGGPSDKIVAATRAVAFENAEEIRKMLEKETRRR